MSLATEQYFHFSNPIAKHLKQLLYRYEYVYKKNQLFLAATKQVFISPSQ